tara:strand:+ start:941 stop:1132 length:192 start_codon:yes stop_codon:yes gene_type:complete
LYFSFHLLDVPFDMSISGEVTAHASTQRVRQALGSAANDRARSRAIAWSAKEERAQQKARELH